MTEALLALVVVIAALSLLALLRLRRLPETHPPRDDDRLPAQMDELERVKTRTEEILERMEEGVVVFNEMLMPVLANQVARDMLGIRGDSLPPRPSSEGILSVARRALVEGSTAEEIVSVWPARKSLRVRATALREQGGVIVVLQDVTGELRSQRIRQQFVANASHELKSPVAGLQALAEAIREAASDDPQAAQRFATRLVSEAERLGRLIADLLDLSRLEDPGNVAYVSIDFSSVTRRVLQESEAAARAKSVAVNAQIADRVHVRGDEQQLELLVRNLVDNAVRYTRDEGSVWVDVFREGSDVVLRVADDGIGIPLRAQARVFERFYRVEKDRSRESGGTGLGLSIAKHVVELHGGHIGVRSELGEGSTFTARLPVLGGPSGNGAGEPAAARPATQG